MSYTTNIDLVSLIEQKSGIRLARVATTWGGEYVGHCPFCKAGENRFHVWPNSDRPRYWCRVCDAKGDAIEFLKQYGNLSFPDACAELGIELEDREDYEPPSFSELIAQDNPPSDKWQEAAKVFIARAEAYLWHPHSPEGREALAYLHSRGLTDETIKRARIGYCPAMKNGNWYSDTFEHWGIDPASIQDEAKRERGRIVIPPGIVIPWFEGDRIWKIAIKRPGQEMSYGQVLGSREGMYNISSVQFDQPAMIVESELCALSVQQEAGDLIACVATGSVSRARRARWIADLSLASFVLQSFDDDAAGDEHAPYWIQKLERCIRWSPMEAKDPNDILQQLGGESLRNWVKWGLYAWENAQRLDAMPELSEAARIPVEVSQGACPELDINEAFVQNEDLERFATTVAYIVNVLGGPEKVAIQRHDGSTFAEHLERSGVRSHAVVSPARNQW